MRLWLHSLALALLLSTVARADDLTPRRSFHRVVSSNGHAVVSYNGATHRVETLLEHPYGFRTPNNAPSDLYFTADGTRDLAFDQYFGVRVGDTGTWFVDVPTTTASYINGTTIIST